jgi:alkaline phosphatase D
MASTSDRAISRRAFLAGTVSAVLAACSRADESDSPPPAPSPTAPTTTGSTTPATTSTTTTPNTATTATVAPTTTALPIPTLDANPFVLGVASGDPTPAAVILWTRLIVPVEHIDDAIPVSWEMATDEAFSDVIARGSKIATKDDAHSVHVDAAGLEPDRFYFYRFAVGPWTSALGRARTMPASDASPDHLVLASASCQSFTDGYYAAHRDLAADDVDLVLWLGDYIYEEAAAPISGSNVRAHTGRECTTLDDYRARYALYKSDPDLQAAHARAPWLVMWDDHEVENNYAGVVSEDASVSPDVFAQRRAAAYRAWWEHQPVRLPAPADGEYKVYRSIGAGPLAKIVLLDGRQYRSDQACGDATLQLKPPCPDITAPGRTMLGTEQEQWFEDQLSTSTATWNIVGNQVVMADARFGEAVLNYDQWDGYPDARQRITSAMARAGRDRTVVITGDIHLAGVTDVTTADGTVVATEFITTSISSDATVPANLVGALEALPHIHWGELQHRGWTKHTITPTTWTAEYRIVDDAKRPDATPSTVARFEVAAGVPGAKQVA